MNNKEVILLSDSTERLMHSFYNKKFVLNGTPSTMKRSEAVIKVRACGEIM